MLIWLSESSLTVLFSEVSLIRDNQGREFKRNSLIINGVDNQVMKRLIITHNQGFHHVSPKFLNSPDNSPVQELVYYETRKRELKTRPMYECRCDERLKTKTEKSTHLTYTGLIRELEHLKIKTRWIDEMFASVMGEYVFFKWFEHCHCFLRRDLN